MAHENLWVEPYMNSYMYTQAIFCKQQITIP